MCILIIGYMIFSNSVERIKFSKATGYFGKNYEDVVNFSLGEPKDMPPASVTNAFMNSVKSGTNRYAPVQGSPELRERLSRKLEEKNNIQASAEEVIITTGGSESIALSIMSLVNPGDEVIVLEPSYPIVAPMISFCGGRPVSLTLRKDNEFWPDMEELKDAVNKKTKMMAVNTPHNPTGTVFSRRCLKAISEIFNGPIMVDEVYENFTYGSDHCSMASIAAVPENVITVNSFSKTYCMCGYRVGYTHADIELIKRMMKIKLCITTCTSNPAQVAAIAALEDEKFPKTMKMNFERRKNLMVESLKSLEMPLVEPEGAFYVFPEISEFGSDDEAFELFMKAGVMTMPGSVFHRDYNNHLRFSFVADESDIIEGISRLEGVIA